MTLKSSKTSSIEVFYGSRYKEVKEIQRSLYIDSVEIKKDRI